MIMTVQQSLITIAVIALGTMLTRFLPFLLFPDGRPVPKYVQYLGVALPPAVLGLLVVYCYKNVNFLSGNHGLPELLAGLSVLIAHKLKKNMFLSIVVGTAVYMILIRLPVFAAV